MTRYRNTKTARHDGYGFGLVALLGAVVVVVLAVVLMVSLYGKASDAIQDVRDCATEGTCQDGGAR